MKKAIYSTLGVLATALIGMAAITGCNSGGNTGSNPIIDGVVGPTVSVVNGTVTISAVLTNVVFQGGVTLAIPHTQNSYIELGPNVASPGMLLQVGLSATDLAFLQSHANDASILPPNELPGGRPLPGIVGGALPSVAVEVPQWNNATFYIGSAIAGIFIPVKFGAQGVTGTFLFFDNTGKQIGTISVVGSDSNGKNSGILLLMNVKSLLPNLAPSTSSLM